MNDKAKYLISGFVVGAVIVWFFTFIVISYNQKNTNFRMGNSMMGNYMESESIDKHFIEQMIPHHEDAVTMSELALEKATRPEVKELTTSIIASQAKEIDQMRNWYEEWFGKEVPADGNVMSGHGMMGGGMHMGVMGTETDIENLVGAEDFDREFLMQMIPHHQMAVMMANMLGNSTTRPEMKQLSEDIIEAQTSEINLMREWLQNWED